MICVEIQTSWFLFWWKHVAVLWDCGMDVWKRNPPLQHVGKFISSIELQENWCLWRLVAVFSRGCSLVFGVKHNKPKQRETHTNVLTVFGVLFLMKDIYCK